MNFLHFVLLAVVLVRSLNAAQILSNSFKLWREPAEPAHIVGPIYFVGTKGLGVYLITTPAGHILLDGGMPASEQLIEDSIRRLGFKVEDIRQLIISQAHFDHVGTLAYFKKKTKASLAVMQGDDGLLKSGGKTDYLFGNATPYHFESVTPDRIIKDGDAVELGGLKLIARHTPGHTQGCTTWILNLVQDQKPLTTVFVGSTSVNPGTRLAIKPSYPSIVADYRSSFTLLASLKPDIFLAAHPEFFNFEQKHQRAATEGYRPYIDVDGYRNHVETQRKNFERIFTEQQSER
jgi:metallo-beta-lactamase class B